MEDEDVVILVIVCYLTILQHINQTSQAVATATASIT